MNYEFPEINTIEDVLPAIGNSPEFLVMDRGFFKVVNYAVVYDDTFPPIKSSGGTAKDRAEKELLKKLRRECRGLIFSRKDGRLLARRYHKFFNLDERAETAADQIDWSKPHIILEKLDGSMVSPVRLDDGKIVWTTKLGVTEIAQDAADWVAKRPNYKYFVEKIMENDQTPIFEWCSRKSRIVVDFPEDKLYLTAIRKNKSGAYLPWLFMNSLVDSFGSRMGKENRVEVVPILALNGGKSFDVSKLEDKEGIVIRFEDGHMVKVKTEWYVLRHKSKELVMREKGVLDLIFNDKVDDILPFLEERDRLNLIRYRDDIQKYVDVSTKVLEEEVKTLAKMAGYNKKRFALEFAARETDPLVIGCVYNYIDGKFEARNAILTFIRNHLGTREKISKVRYLWGFRNWDMYNV